MYSNGIDMYELLPTIAKNDPHLKPTGKKFWVGVIEGMYPSPPVPRQRTECYSAADVYLYFNNWLVFGMSTKTEDGSYTKDFYTIPLEEEKFIQ